MTTAFLPILAQMSTWLVNPGLFVAGAILVALPIIIHLLNKRKFKVVDWAAMDFLLDADKKNRRRVRLENLILLLLRCAAVFLLGLLLARPFLSSEATAGLLNAAQYERIIVLDDSLSQQARQGNESAWESAKKQTIDLIRDLAGQPSDNTLTMILTSAPEERQFNSAHLGKDTVDEVVAAVEKLEPTDGAARFEQTLLEVETYLSSQPANVNRVLYVVSDLRRHDWSGAENNQNRPTMVMQRLGKACAGAFVLDCAETDDRNLTIRDVRPESTLVAGVTSRIDVVIGNAGTAEAKDVRVRLTSGDSLPIVQEIDKIPASGTETTSFSTVFTAEENENAEFLPPRQVKIEVLTAKQGDDDRLAADSVLYFPARIVPGVPVLIVDGDPSADYGRAESFYLRRALAPKGNTPSGIRAEIVTEQEFETLPLEKYQIVILCNVYRLGDKTAEAVQRLEKWVEKGGGLVIMPGDQVDEQYFDEYYYRDGAGPAPIRLEGIKGDETEGTWVNFRLDKPQHPILKVFEGANNPFLDNVKTFRYWGGSIKKEQLGKDVSVIASFSDAEDSPAIVEKPLGRGRVVMTTIPADADWTSWTSDPSYLYTMQELVRYLNGDRSTPGLLQVGQPIRQPVSLSQYEIDATVVGPHEKKAQVQAAADDALSAGGGDNAIWLISFDETKRQGFYDLKLARRDGLTESALFAANVDPAEGNLQRVEPASLQRELGDGVKVLSKGQTAVGKIGDRSEIWWYLLWAVAGVLGIEQLLGWWFGRRR